VSILHLDIVVVFYVDERDFVAKNIKLMIKSSGKNQAQVAREMAMTEANISDYVNGRAVPTIFTLKKLCQILDCTYEDILGPL